MSKMAELKITSAVVIAGKIVRPDQGNESIVTVDERVAKNLLDRGKAELTTADDDADDKPLDEYTVPQLKALAKDYKIDGADGMKKAELIAAIEAVEAE